VRFQASRVRAGGDVILAVDGKKVIGHERPSPASSPLTSPATRSLCRVLKDGSKQNIEVTLGTRPTSISG